LWTILSGVQILRKGATVLDAEYFNSVLPDQILKHGSSVTVEIRLHDGRSYQAKSIHTVQPGYVVLEVCDPLLPVNNHVAVDVT
jgi:hypothetical protein